MSADTEALRLQAALMREAEELRVKADGILDGSARDLADENIARLEMRIDGLGGDA